MPDYVGVPSSEDWEIGCKLFFVLPFLAMIVVGIVMGINKLFGGLGGITSNLSSYVNNGKYFFFQIGHHDAHALLIFLLILLISGVAFLGAFFAGKSSESIGGCIFFLIATVCFVVFVGSLAIGGWEFFFS